MGTKHHPFIHLITILCCVLLASAIRKKIRNAQELIDLFEDPIDTTVKVNIELVNDLDFSGVNLNRPLGSGSNRNDITYSGVFQGNGYSIKNLVMNNGVSTNIMTSALFYKVKDSTFENLIIDSSCSFSSLNVGALAVSATGSLNVINVINKANIDGDQVVGAFVAVFEGNSVSFENCINNGDVTGSYGVGGFLGGVMSDSSVTSVTVNISNSINNGKITGSGTLGGLVSVFALRQPMTVTITNCTNNGIVTGKNDTVAGLVGSCLLVEDLINELTMTISNCINNGVITAQNHAAGLVGNVDHPAFSTLIINGVNKGTISAKNDIACGLLCTESTSNQNANITILNSVNKGSVRAEEDAHGIANIVTKASNIVSMGDVTSPSYPFTFWKNSKEASLYYGLYGKCLNCNADATIFYYNVDKGIYTVVEKGNNVQRLLNEESAKQHYGAKWTKELDLAFGLDPLSSSLLHSLSPIALALAFILIHVMDF